MLWEVEEDEDEEDTPLSGSQLPVSPLDRALSRERPALPRRRGVRGFPSKGLKEVPGEKRISSLCRRGWPTGKEKFS